MDNVRCAEIWCKEWPANQLMPSQRHHRIERLQERGSRLFWSARNSGKNRGYDWGRRKTMLNNTHLENPMFSELTKLHAIQVARLQPPVSLNQSTNSQMNSWHSIAIAREPSQMLSLAEFEMTWPLCMIPAGFRSEHLTRSADPSSLWGGARLGSCCRRLWSNGGGLDERDSSTNLAVSHDLSTGGLQASKSYVAQRFALLEATFFFVFSRFQKQRFGIFLFSAFFVGSKSNVSAVFWLRFRMVWAYIPFFLMGSDSDVSAFFRLRFRNGLGTKPAGVLPFRMRVPNTFFLSLAWWLAGFFFVFSRVQKQRFGSFLAAVSHGLGPISFSF